MYRRCFFFSFAELLLKMKDRRSLSFFFLLLSRSNFSLRNKLWSLKLQCLRNSNFTNVLALFFRLEFLSENNLYNKLANHNTKNSIRDDPRNDLQRFIFLLLRNKKKTESLLTLTKRAQERFKREPSASAGHHRCRIRR